MFLGSFIAFKKKLTLLPNQKCITRCVPFLLLIYLFKYDKMSKTQLNTK